jgi:chromosome segregation ATPase
MALHARRVEERLSAFLELLDGDSLSGADPATFGGPAAESVAATALFGLVAAPFARAAASKTEGDVSGLRGEADRLRAEAEVAKRELFNKTEEFARQAAKLREELAGKQAEAEAHLERLSKAEHEAARLRSELEAGAERAKEAVAAQADVGALEEEIRSTREELARATARRLELEAELAEVGDSERESARAAAERSRAEAEASMRSRMEALERDAKSALEELGSRTRELKAVREEGEARERALNVRMEELTLALSESEARLSLSVKEERERLVSEVITVREQGEALLKAQLAERDSEVKRLREELAATESNADDKATQLRAAKLAASEAVKASEAAASSSKAEILRLKTAQRDLEEQLSQATEALKDRVGQVKDLEKSLGEARESHGTASSSLEGVRAELAREKTVSTGLRERVHQLEEEVSGVRAELSEREAELERACASLKRQTEEATLKAQSSYEKGHKEGYAAGVERGDQQGYERGMREGTQEAAGRIEAAETERRTSIERAANTIRETRKTAGRLTKKLQALAAEYKTLQRRHESEQRRRVAAVAKMDEMEAEMESRVLANHSAQALLEKSLSDARVAAEADALELRERRRKLEESAIRVRQLEDELASYRDREEQELLDAEWQLLEAPAPGEAPPLPEGAEKNLVNEWASQVSVGEDDGKPLQKWLARAARATPVEARGLAVRRIQRVDTSQAENFRLLIMPSLAITGRRDVRVCAWWKRERAVVAKLRLAAVPLPEGEDPEDESAWVRAMEDARERVFGSAPMSSLGKSARALRTERRPSSPSSPSSSIASASPRLRPTEQARRPRRHDSTTPSAAAAGASAAMMMMMMGDEDLPAKPHNKADASPPIKPRKRG